MTQRVVALLLFGALPLSAQAPAVPDAHPAVRQALALVKGREAATIDEQVALCQIPSPPFKEAVRAAAFRDRLAALGLKNVRIDSVGNVIAERPGTESIANLAGVVIAGHLDTVFPEGTDVTVKRDGKILRGPGIEDNCRGLAIVLAVARALDQAKISTRATIYFVGTVGEEGAGNLRGVRYLFNNTLHGKAGSFISVDADALNAVKDAVGSYRYTVTFSGPGGHSFGAFGMPNPAHALGRAIAAISDFQVPASPKTTFSVGILEAGTSVNAIPAKASFQLDIRSESGKTLDAMHDRFMEVVAKALAAEKARWPQSTVALEAKVDRWGLRPAGAQAADAPIVLATAATANVLGFTPTFSASSTDANHPIGLGIPAITIGGGGKATGGHSLDEAWDSTDSHLGTQWSLLLLVTMAGVK